MSSRRSLPSVRPGRVVGEHLKVRIAWAYYNVEGMTQGEVAARFGINRIHVNRLLATCREEGIVQININSPHASFAKLETAFEKRWGCNGSWLRRVRPPGSTCARLLRRPPAATSRSASAKSDHSALAGARPFAGVSSINRRVIPDLSIVALMGGLTASHLAELLGAKCYYIAAPAFGRDETSRDLLLSQDIIREVLDHARRVECAVVSVGSFDPTSTLVRLGLTFGRDCQSAWNEALVERNAWFA